MWTPRKSSTSIMEREITDKKLEKYFSVTRRALEKVKLSAPERTSFSEIGKEYLDMAQRYFDDAHHFKEQKDYVTAFAALNYAHGWLDAGARIGIFDVDHDSELFTVD